LQGLYSAQESAVGKTNCDLNLILKRIIQIIVAWLVKWLSPGFQDRKPREGLTASVADGSDNREVDSAADAPLMNSRELLGGTPDNQAEAPVTECSHVESEKRNPHATGFVAIPKEEGGRLEAVIEGQEPQAQPGKLSGWKVPTPAIEIVAETDAPKSDSELLVAGAVPETESVETVARPGPNSEQSLDAEDDIITTPPTGNDQILLDKPDTSVGSPKEESLTTIDDIGVADSSITTTEAKKLPSSESEWDAYTERPEVGSGKPAPAKTTKAVKDTEALFEGIEDSAEIKSQGIERENKPPAPIDISAYEGPGLASLPDSYLFWNRILLKRFVTVAAGEQILLATSPRALAAALFDDIDERVPASEAQGRFVGAVALAYKSGVVGSPARLRIFRRHVIPDGIPACVAFLALSVLAAHKMHTDETSWSSDYYSRLSELLGVERGANGLPTDFRSDEFESLWLFLANWISKKKGWSLVLPQGNVQKRFIAYPLAHVPLRQLDLEKLPTFFEWAGYSSEIQPTMERLEDDLRKWDQSYGSFSSAGRDALNDGRMVAVLAQVRSELRSWDGLVSDSEGVRYSQVEILLETVGRRSKLSLLAPRREGFPELFSSGPVQMTGGDSWYDPLDLNPEDGTLLKEGFSWTSENQTNCVLRRSPGMVFALAPNSDYSGLVSRMDLPKGVVCAVLCHQSLVTAVASYLASVCDSVPRPFHENSGPNDWFLFMSVRAIRRSDNVPSELRALDVASEVNIVPLGGLRAGAQWAWMQGEAPRLLIEGHDGQPVYVNDATVDLDEEEYIGSGDIFAVAGVYRVRVGSFEKKVRIVRPSLRPSALPEGHTSAETGQRRHSVVLEVGHWFLVGRCPGEISTVDVGDLHSSLIFCDFEPAWAIQLGARRLGTKVIQLLNEPVEVNGTIKKLALVRSWASTICAAAIRRPTFESASDDGMGATDKFWGEYVRVARAIKRPRVAALPRRRRLANLRRLRRQSSAREKGSTYEG
jgi:hypothetical protein